MCGTFSGQWKPNTEHKGVETARHQLPGLGTAATGQRALWPSLTARPQAPGSARSCLPPAAICLMCPCSTRRLPSSALRWGSWASRTHRRFPPESPSLLLQTLFLPAHVTVGSAHSPPSPLLSDATVFLYEYIHVCVHTHTLLRRHTGGKQNIKLPYTIQEIHDI